ATLDYEPGESECALFGGNSNWRGPIWFAINHLIGDALRRFHAYLGDEFKVECPTGSGRLVTLPAVSNELSQRLASLFPDPEGRRAAFGGGRKCARGPPSATP